LPAQCAKKCLDATLSRIQFSLMAKGRNTGRSPQARLIKSRPDSAEARDEGPRLIPLDEPKKVSMENYSRKYLELADMALKPPKKS
jgi:hypothetical protein